MATNSQGRTRRWVKALPVLAGLAAFVAILTLGTFGPIPTVVAYSSLGGMVMALIPIQWIARRRVTFGWDELYLLLFGVWLIWTGATSSASWHVILGGVIYLGVAAAFFVPRLGDPAYRKRLGL